MRNYPTTIQNSDVWWSFKEGTHKKYASRIFVWEGWVDVNNQPTRYSKEAVTVITSILDKGGT